jgi:hypothetical protein
MKKNLTTAIMLILLCLSVQAQKGKDALYLKNGSIIYGRLLEVTPESYKVETSDKSIFIFKSEEVEKFSKAVSGAYGRKSEGFSFALEAGLLAGAQNTDYAAPFSFNFLAGAVIKTKTILSAGSGVEFIGRPFTPLFLEFRQIIFDTKTSPFIYVRGGTLVALGDDDKSSYISYEPYNHKGGALVGFGSGISWARDDYEMYLSFGYRFSHTSYQRDDYNNRDILYTNNLSRLEMKFGFRF